MTMNATQQQSRIPLGLQAVFLASNRGKEVDKPPAEKAASKTFTRSWMFQGLKKGGKSRRTKGSKSRQDRLQKVSQFGGTSVGSDTSHTSINSSSEEEPVARIKSNTIKVIRQEGPTASVTAPKAKASARPPMSPQAYLDVMIHSRGYSTRRYRTLQTGYYSKPTEYQQASYHVNLVKLVRNHKVEEFKGIVGSGISPNPCNAYGESLLHMVCRRGDHDLLQIMLDVGSSVQVADDYGRTPLHDACWAATPSFATVEKIANRDITLFHMTDSRGAVPLSYVRREHWPEWIEFLEGKKDTWWPPIRGVDEPSVLVDIAPNERPIPMPENALSMELAGMVASGVMTPDEAKVLMEEDEAMDDEDSDSDSDYDSDDSDSDDDDDDSDDDSESDSDDDDSSIDEDEEFEAMGFNMADMKDMMKRAKFAKGQAAQ